MGDPPFIFTDLTKSFEDTTIVLDFFSSEGRPLKEALSDILVIREEDNQIRIVVDSRWFAQPPDDYIEMAVRAVKFGRSLEIDAPTRLPFARA